MSNPDCPICGMSETLANSENWECATCGHEWAREVAPEAQPEARIIKDAYGNVLSDGDVVMLIKDLPLRGSSQVLKGGLKSKPIRLVDGDHEIQCKVDGDPVWLKACYVKKV